MPDSTRPAEIRARLKAADTLFCDVCDEACGGSCEQSEADFRYLLAENERLGSDLAGLRRLYSTALDKILALHAELAREKKRDEG